MALHHLHYMKETKKKGYYCTRCQNCINKKNLFREQHAFNRKQYIVSFHAQSSHLHLLYPYIKIIPGKIDLPPFFSLFLVEKECIKALNGKKRIRTKPVYSQSIGINLQHMNKVHRWTRKHNKVTLKGSV